MLLVKPVIAVTALLLLVGCDSEESPPVAATTEGPTTEATTSEPPTDPLEGSWETDPITLVDAKETLRTYDLAEYVQGFGSRSPVVGTTTLILDLHDGEWDLYGQVAGGAPFEIDYNAAYKVDGDKVAVVHSAGENTFRWSVEGETLTLEWLRSTLPDFKGVPEEVFQRVLYMTADFQRQAA